MANSWINAAAVFGFELRVATPPGYEPDAAVVERAQAAGARIVYTHDPLEAAAGADVLNTDVWASMGQEAEQQEREKAFAGFQIDERDRPRRRPRLHRPALPAGPPRRGDQRRGHRRSPLRGLRRGGEPTARAEGDHGHPDGVIALRSCKL